MQLNNIKTAALTTLLLTSLVAACGGDNGVVFDAVPSRDAPISDASLTVDAGADAARTVYFSEDFEGGTTMPVGFTLLNVDGNTPDPGVTGLGFDATDATAWIVNDDLTMMMNNVAMSTSWYTPPAASDDWMITPVIDIGPTNVMLSWDSKAQDMSFPDGYEVYISTTDATVVGCMANAALFTIAGENPTFTARSVDLSALGYANQSVHICFRNNANDQFLLLVDNIVVQGS